MSARLGTLVAAREVVARARTRTSLSFVAITKLCLASSEPLKAATASKRTPQKLSFATLSSNQWVIDVFAGADIVGFFIHAASCESAQIRPGYTASQDQIFVPA